MRHWRNPSEFYVRTPTNPAPNILLKTGLVFILLFPCLQMAAREKDRIQYGTGLIVNIPYPENQVVQVVQQVVENGIIRGSKEYNKDDYVSGAKAASSTKVFPKWTEDGKVFYKVRLKVLDPRNFKDSNDVGTLAVRYVVQAQDERHTVLRVDARFIEDFRRTAHPSNGSVEGAEYKDIHDRLESLALVKVEAAEAQKTNLASSSKDATAVTTEVAAVPSAKSVAAQRPSAASSEPDSTGETLEQHVQDLRRRVERLVKAPGAPLKSAPFHSAATLQSLPPGTEVLIVISTSYWLGVETHDGQHGWILRDELELLK